MSELLTVPEVAQKLRLGVSTVYGLVRSGELPSLLFGSAVRLDPSDVEIYLASCRRTTTKPANAGATNLTGLLTDADSALESYFRGTGQQPRRKPMRASKTESFSPLSLVHDKASR